MAYQVKYWNRSVDHYPTFQKAWDNYSKGNIWEITFNSLDWENASHKFHQWIWFTKKEFLKKWLPNHIHDDYLSEMTQKACELSPAFSLTDDDDEKVIFWIDIPLDTTRFVNELNRVRDQQLPPNEDQEARDEARRKCPMFVLNNVLTESEFKNLYWDC